VRGGALPPTFLGCPTPGILKNSAIKTKSVGANLLKPDGDVNR
jgi:hypothetical protein